MAGTNGWDVIAGGTEDYLNGLLKAWFDNMVATGKIPSWTIAGQTVGVSDPKIVICADPDSDTGWTSCVEVEADLSIVQDEGTITVKCNLAQLFIGTVSQETYLRSDGATGSGADCGALLSPLASSGYTLMGWVKLSTTDDQTLLSVVDSSTTLLALSVGGNLPSLYLEGASQPYTYTLGSDYPDLTDGSWHHVAIVLDDSNNSLTVTFYIDGQPQATVSVTSIPVLSGNLKVGLAYSDNGSLNGDMTGVSIWPSVLSASELQQLMNADLASGDLPAGLTCFGYWEFDPNDAVNLLDPSVSITTTGNASCQQDEDPGWETFLYFATNELDSIFVVSNTMSSTYQSKINDAVDSNLQATISKAAVSIGSSANAAAGSNGAVYSSHLGYVGFITETQTDDWSGSSQALALCMMNNGIPPQIDNKTVFADDATVEVPSGQNLVLGISDYFFFTLVAQKIAEQGKFSATVNTNPVDLVATAANFNKFVSELTLTFSIANGSGINVGGSAEAGLVDGDTWDIDISTVVSFSVVGSGESTQIQLKISNPDLSVVANQSSKLVQSFEIAMAVFELSIALIPLAIVCRILADIWYGIVYVILFEEINKYVPSDYVITIKDSGNFQLSEIAFEDGIFVYGTLNPIGALITKLSTETGYPGDTVEITGKYFVDSNGDSLLASAEIGGQSASIVSVTGDSDSAVATVEVPTGGTGVPTAVKVKTTSDLWSNLFGHFVVLGNADPSDVELSETQGVAGDSISITGSGFTGTTKVEFGTASASFTVDSDTSITAIVPNGLSSNTAVTVTVTNNKSSAESSNQFSLYPAPTITSAKGPDGNAEAKAGETVTIVGTGFIQRTGQPMQALFSRNTSGTFTANPVDVDITDDTTGTCTVPTGATPGYLYVTTAAGESGGYAFEVEGSDRPTVSGFSPPYGGSSDSFTVTGTNFTGASKVTIGGQNCVFALDSDSGDGNLTAIVPLTADSGVVGVANSAGSGTSSATFYVVSRPKISSLDETSGAAGDPVTINGSNFETAAGEGVVEKVTIGLVDSAYSVESSSKIKATVPEGATGIPGGITVVTVAGSATSSQSFTVLGTAAPKIDSFSADSGTPASTFEINGQYFTGTSQVTINDAVCAFSVTSDTVLKVWVPNTTPGTYNVYVTNSVDTTESTETFTVTSS